MPDEEPRIIVDSDWKKEAQAEKERLIEETADSGPTPEPGQANFLDIVNMIAMQAIVSLGGVKMPDGREVPQDLAVAKYHIDLLEVLASKTAGQLDDTERKVLESALHELRMGFVQTTSGPQGSPESQSTD